MNKICIKNFLFILIFLPSLFISKVLDNDFYFLYKHGEYVIKKGIPYIEPFSMHSNLEFIMQQWLSAVIYYLIYEYFTNIGVILFVMVINILATYLLYKTIMLISNNLYLSYIMTFICVIGNFMFITTRPFTITYLLTIILLYTLIKYTKTNNKKLLLILPVLSLIQINIQSSMWIFLLIMILPFIFESKLFTSKNIYCDLYDKLPLYLSILTMIFTAFINPYGIDAIFYVFKSYNNTSLEIAEMQSPSLFNASGEIIIVMFVICTLILILVNEKINIRYIFLYWGCFILTMFAMRNTLYLIIATIFFLSDLLKNIDSRIILEKVFGLYEIYIPIITIIFLIIGVYSFKNINNDNKIFGYSGIDYLIENENINNEMTIYTGYNDGSYAIFKGFKVYLDARMEVYLESQNNKYNYLLEYSNLQEGKLNYKNFLEKYNFDFILVSKDDIMYYYLEDNNLEKVYSDDYCNIYRY